MKKNTEADPTFYRELLDSMPDGIVVAGNDLRIVSLNEPSENILNVSRRKAVGKRVSKIFPPEINRLCERAIKERRVIQKDDLAFRAPSGTAVRVECTVAPAHGSDGDPRGLIIQIRDMSKTDMLSIMNRNSSFGENYEILVRGLAHEMRNPLSGIKGAAQLMSGALSDRERDRCSRIIIKEAERLRDLLDRLVKPSSLAAESTSPVDINEILIDIIFLESNLHEDIKFTRKLDVAIPPVPGDYNSLKQVFINLVQNAAAAVRGKGEITVSTKWVSDYRIRDRNTVLISVRDNGAGIERKNLKKIFTPFFSGRKDGTGLGLFISSQVIAKYGGVITAESEEGKGSVFRVQLPAGR